MKKVLIMCGAGHATSTIVRAKFENWLASENLVKDVTIKQSAIGDEVQNIAEGKYDIVISTTQVPNNIKDKVINGIGFLTGVGIDQIYSKIKKQIKD